MILPATRYQDCDAALVFLRDVLGLTEHAVFRDDMGAIVHAQMGAGTGMMMFGPRQGGAFDRFIVDPAETGGRETTTIYVVVDDITARYRQVTAAGVRPLIDLEAQAHGGQSFTVADPEGHIWTFGDYDPRG